MQLYTALLVALVLASGSAWSGHRSAAVRMEFQRHNPCPSTGLRRGSCPGYEIDHVVPLCARGPDRVENLQWLTVQAHRAKTRGDVRHCAAERRRARQPDANTTE
ncbi:MAG: HNH endonuclease signature motif containing protein [Ramlibacter sp.]